MQSRFSPAKTLLWCLTLLPFVASAQVLRQAQQVPRQDVHPVEVAVFCINDFHGAFVASAEKGIAGAAAVCETLDSLKRVYPCHLTVSAGDNFGGSYFYKVTGGQLMPLFFHEAGIRLSAIGNHEFDDGQDALAAKWADSPLRPKDWDMTYVCANVRNAATGTLPPFASATALTEVTLPGGKKFPVAFAGLLTSAAPHQVSARRVKGLSFDGRYDVVLDSVLATPEGEALKEAPLRLLLAHIGTAVNAEGQPVWDDPDAEALTKLRPGDWNGFFSSHTHQKVRGHINKNRMPVVQGLWHADYISALIF
ncbi:MAG: metallophosphoesterase, partial [Alloprevotella sp.]